MRDIIPPAPQSRAIKQQQPKGSGAGGGGSDGRQKSWGDRAWGLVAAGGMGCGADNAEGGAVTDDDDESCATEEEEGSQDGEEGEGCGGGDDGDGDAGEEGFGGARDIRAFATTLIEMVLK